MKYGEYYVDCMPVGDETGDHYCVVYLGDPKEKSDATELHSFTITEVDEQTFGGLEQAIVRYMKGYYPGAEILIEGCTAVYDPDIRHLTIRLFGKIIVSTELSGAEEEDYWVGYNHKGQELDFNFCYSRDDNEYSLNVCPVVDGTTNTSISQALFPAFDVCGDIKNLLMTIGTDDFCLANVEAPSVAMWRDNKDNIYETTVLRVGMDKENDLYLLLDDGWADEVTIWESAGQLSDNDLDMVRDNIIERLNERICTECGRPVFEGFYNGLGDPTEYYCSDGCLHKHYTPEQWKEMCKEGLSEDDIEEGENCGDYCYWTEWWEA